MKSIKNRITFIIKILRKQYGKPKTMLLYKTTFELLIATILSAQCTDKRVNMVTPGIFKKYKDVKGFAKAKQTEMEQDIKSTGFFRNKSKNIIALSNRLIGEYQGKVPDSMEELITLPGVARKTANIILSHCYNKSEGIAVDTHVARLSKKLGLTKHKDPNKIEKDLMNIVPKKDWLYFNGWLVEHGRAICNARKSLCEECELCEVCPSCIVTNSKL